MLRFTMINSTANPVSQKAQKPIETKHTIRRLVTGIHGTPFFLVLFFLTTFLVVFLFLANCL